MSRRSSIPQRPLNLCRIPNESSNGRRGQLLRGNAPPTWLIWEELHPIDFLPLKELSTHYLRLVPSRRAQALAAEAIEQGIDAVRSSYQI